MRSSSGTQDDRPPIPIAFALLCTLVLATPLGGCRRPYQPPFAAPTDAVTAAPEVQLTPVQRVGLDWIRRARAAEPVVTGKLQEIAQAQGGELAGLEHKIKSLSSTVSKVERLRDEEPDTPLDAIEVYDVLRYTLLVPDSPPGHHDAAIRGALHALEDDGYEVRRVKNYWKRGDSYSGTNCTLATPDGLLWELQIHTPASYETKSATHDDYELMRNSSTPIAERRRLFEKMKKVWERIPIPEGILVPGSLHANEEIRLLPAP